MAEEYKLTEMPKLDEANSNDENSKSNDLNAILTISIDIGEGKVEKLIVKSSDNIDCIVKEFCQDHGLDDDQMNQLGGKIKESMLELEKEGISTQPVQQKHHTDKAGSPVKMPKAKINSNPMQYNNPVIDPHSKSLVESKGLNSVPVYERLNKLAAVKKKRQDAETPANDKLMSAEKAIKLTDRLYHTGKKKIQMKDRKIMEIKEKFECQEKECSTFSPKINKHSQYMLNTSNADKDIIEFLKKQQIHREPKPEYLSFSPSINKNSTVIDPNKNQEKERHDILYEDYKKRLEKRSKASHLSHSFKPKIIKVDLTKPEIKTDHTDTMHVYTNLPSKELTFSPKIGKSPSIRDPMPIGDRLHGYQALYNEELQKKKDLMGMLTSYGSTTIVINKSEKMVESQRNRKYEELFNELDSKKLGYIATDNINIYGLSNRMLELYTPLFNQMEDTHAKVTYEEFRKESEKIYKKLDPATKAVFNSPSSTINLIEQPSFSPKLNQSSLDIAKKSKRPPDQSWYSIIKNDNDKFQQQLAVEKEKKELEEVSKCTFHPVINENKSSFTSFMTTPRDMQRPSSANYIEDP